MAQVKRNLNLEELSSGSLDVQLLENQTVFQKILFISTLIIVVAFPVINILFSLLPTLLMVFLNTIIIIVGALFSCNYNKDLTLAKFFYAKLKKSKVELLYKSSEDIDNIRKNGELIQNEKLKSLKENSTSVKEEEEKARKKVFKMLLIFLICAVLLIALAVVKNNNSGTHHTVAEVQTITYEV